MKENNGDAAQFELACVSVAVRSIRDALPAYTAGLGLTVVGPMRSSPRGFNLRWVELGAEGKGFIELLEPSGGGGPIERFLARRGEGVYQVRLLADCLDEAVKGLERRGVRVIRGPELAGEPRLAWIHPDSTHGVLFELFERE